MQYIGYLLINNEKIKVLVREAKTYRSLKIRKSGEDGNRLSDESDHLVDHPFLIRELKNGISITL